MLPGVLRARPGMSRKRGFRTFRWAGAGHLLAMLWLFPGSAFSSQVTASGFSGQVPASALSDQVPASALSDQVPASALSDQVPASARPGPAGTLPRRTVRSAPVPEDTVPAGASEPARRVSPRPDERHLTKLRMLTRRGQNAEAYYSADGSKLIFQRSAPDEFACDQIFVMGTDGSDRRLVSTGEGKTTCGYFFPSGDRILFSSTHLAGPGCPPPPDYSRGYVWPLDDYDIFTADPDGSGLERLTETPGYDAEATISPDGSRIVFTSVRDGDLEIYTMAPDGSDVRRLTHQPGYDGGPFYSADGTKIVYRGFHPDSGEALRAYRSLLERGLVRPTVMEIYVMGADGSNKRRITDFGAASFAPFFHPDGERVIFSSNLHDPDSRNFDLYMIDLDGEGLERITTHPDFDGFPMFSRDGRRLVFASNRNNRQPGDTNIFVAEWVENPGRPGSRAGTGRTVSAPAARPEFAVTVRPRASWRSGVSPHSHSFSPHDGPGALRQTSGATPPSLSGGAWFWKDSREAWRKR